MSETEQPIRGVEALPQEELGEMITVGSDLFNQLYPLAEQQGTLQVGGARIEAIRDKSDLSKVTGHANDGNYDDKELEITFKKAPDKGSIFTVRKFPPDRVATWRVDVSHTTPSNPAGISYTIDQLKEGQRPEGAPAGSTLKFTQSFDKPDVSRYQADVQTLKTLSVAAKALPR